MSGSSDTPSETPRPSASFLVALHGSGRTGAGETAAEKAPIRGVGASDAAQLWVAKAPDDAPPPLKSAPRLPFTAYAEIHPPATPWMAAS